MTRKTKHSHLKLSKVNQNQGKWLLRHFWSWKKMFAIVIPLNFNSSEYKLFSRYFCTNDINTMWPFIAVLSLYHLHRYLHSIALFQTQSRPRLHLKCTLPLLSVHLLNHPRPLFPFPCFRCKFPHRQLPLPLRALPVWIWTYLRGPPEATLSWQTTIVSLRFLRIVWAINSNCWWIFMF